MKKESSDHILSSGLENVTTAVDDIDKNEPTKTPSDNFAPHNYIQQTTCMI